MNFDFFEPFYGFNDKILKVFDKDLMPCMILIDLQKAFDTIDHGTPFQKLYPVDFLKHT